jgi:hypothetical protein
MEACLSVHFVSRTLRALGTSHECRQYGRRGGERTAENNV